MDLTVHGDQSTYEKLSEKPEWSWSLYPPKFYLSSFPVPSTDAFSAHLPADDHEDYDTAIYKMEHNFIESMAVEVLHGSNVEVHGKVELFGKMVEFVIRWAAAKVQADRP